MLHPLLFLLLIYFHHVIFQAWAMFKIDFKSKSKHTNQILFHLLIILGKEEEKVIFSFSAPHFLQFATFIWWNFKRRFTARSFIATYFYPHIHMQFYTDKNMLWNEISVKITNVHIYSQVSTWDFSSQYYHNDSSFRFVSLIWYHILICVDTNRSNLHFVPSS